MNAHKHILDHRLTYSKLIDPVSTRFVAANKAVCCLSTRSGEDAAKLGLSLVVGLGQPRLPAKLNVYLGMTDDILQTYDMKKKPNEPKILHTSVINHNLGPPLSTPTLPPLLILLCPHLHIRHRPDRRKQLRINIPVTFEIIILDVLEIRRLLEPGRLPVQILQIPVQSRVIVSDGAHVAFEMRHVDGVKAHEGRVRFEIDLGEVAPEDEEAVVGGEQEFEFIQSVEHGAAGGFVLGLSLGEAGFVDAAVQTGD